MKRSLLVGILGIAAIAFPLPAEDWPQLKYDSERSGNVPERQIETPLGLLAAVPATDAILASPVVTSGRILVVDAAGVLFCVEASTGKVIWKHESRGGRDNTASGPDTTVSGGQLNDASGWYATVGGGGFNSATGTSSVVAGGGGQIFGIASSPNTASGDWSTVGGGGNNTASGHGAVVAGGGGPEPGLFPGKVGPNTASGDWSTVSGGGHNSATGDSSTVGGGRSNRCEAATTTVSGGYRNTASALVLFLSCERSSWQVATIPVGTWVIRTAVATLFTFCPPAPPLWKISISRSSGLIDTSTSSALGKTATVAVEV